MTLVMWRALFPPRAIATLQSEINAKGKVGSISIVTSFLWEDSILLREMRVHSGLCKHEIIL